MSGTLYRRTENGIEAMDPTTSAELVRYGEGNVKEALDALKSAEGNHTHNYAGSSSAGGAANSALACTGNAATASKLAAARTISLTGKATGSASFDGSGDVSIATSIANATTSESGLMSPADKQKLNSLTSGGGAPSKTLLWSGSWGASGSSAISVAGLSDYSELVFVTSNGQCLRVVNDSVMTIMDVFLHQTNGGTMYTTIRMARAENALSVLSAKSVVVAATGAVAVIDQTANRIVEIWGA